MLSHFSFLFNFVHFICRNVVIGFCNGFSNGMTLTFTTPPPPLSNLEEKIEVFLEGRLKAHHVSNRKFSQMFLSQISF
jgi:hypothetical protein